MKKYQLKKVLLYDEWEDLWYWDTILITKEK